MSFSLSDLDPTYKNGKFGGWCRRNEKYIKMGGAVTLAGLSAATANPYLAGASVGLGASAAKQM